jgi:predicted DNA-binding WGR domain protein
MPTYHCKEGDSNKFWSYENSGDLGVIVKWGRVGQTGQEKAQSFSSRYSRDAFVEKKVREKTDKGYKLISEEKVEQEKRVADQLGSQNKVQRIEFCSLNRNMHMATVLSEYDPTQWVFVEVLNSWTKETNFYLLSTKESICVGGVSVHDGKIEYSSSSSVNSATNRGIREYLKGLAEQVVQVVKRAFGMTGRKLSGLGGSDEKEEALIPSATQMQTVMAQVSSDASAQVVSRFASLGARKLSL